MENGYFSSPRSVVALGGFDGVHIGHKRLLGLAKAEADLLGLPFYVYTFENREKEKANGLIFPFETRKELLLACGADKVIAEDFGLIKDKTPEEFVSEVLVSQLNAEAAFCGFNYMFGKNRSGNEEKLQALMEQNGRKAIAVPAVSVSGEVVSSTLIKKKLRAGDISGVNGLLGYRYFCDVVFTPECSFCCSCVIPGDGNYKTDMGNVEITGNKLVAENNKIPLNEKLRIYFIKRNE